MKQQQTHLCYWSRLWGRSQPDISWASSWWRCARSSSAWTSPRYGTLWWRWRSAAGRHSASIYTWRGGAHQTQSDQVRRKSCRLIAQTSLKEYQLTNLVHYGCLNTTIVKDKCWSRNTSGSTAPPGGAMGESENWGVEICTNKKEFSSHLLWKNILL